MALAIVALSPALAATPVGPTYVGLQAYVVQGPYGSQVYGLQPPYPVNVTAVLGRLYLRNGSFYTEGEGPYVTVQLNVDLIGRGAKGPEFLWAQDVAAVGGSGPYEVSLIVNLWNFTGPAGYQPGYGQPVNYSVVVGSAHLVSTPMGAFLLSRGPWFNVDAPLNLTLAIAAEGEYVGFYYSIGGPLRPLLVVSLPVNVSVAVWPGEDMDAEFVVGGYGTGGVAHVTSWDGEAYIRYYYGPWSPPSPPSRWYCFPAVWAEGYQTAEGLSSSEGISVTPNLTGWSFSESAGPSGGQTMVAEAVLRPIPGNATAYLWPACANWTVTATYLYGGSMHEVRVGAAGESEVSLDVPAGSTYVNLTAVAWVGGFPAFINSTAYGRLPRRGPSLIGGLASMGPLSYVVVLALVSVVGAAVGAAVSRRVHRAPA